MKQLTAYQRKRIKTLARELGPKIILAIVAEYCVEHELSLLANPKTSRMSKPYRQLADKIIKLIK